MPWRPEGARDGMCYDTQGVARGLGYAALKGIKSPLRGAGAMHGGDARPCVSTGDAIFAPSCAPLARGYPCRTPSGVGHSAEGGMEEACQEEVYQGNAGRR
jgi:hypothetical protein